MIKKIDDDEKYLSDEEGGEGGESGGKGGKSGAIDFHYRDILSDPINDVLPDSEVNHLLVVHEDIHKERVDKQKIERKEREKIKQGLVSANNYDALGLRVGGSGSGGGTSPYKSHFLSEHAQFSGATDRKVTGVPSESLSQTNEGEQNNLVNDLTLQNRLKMDNRPKFDPRPRGPYG